MKRKVQFEKESVYLGEGAPDNHPRTNHFMESLGAKAYTYATLGEDEGQQFIENFINDYQENHDCQFQIYGGGPLPDVMLQMYTGQLLEEKASELNEEEVAKLSARRKEVAHYHSYDKIGKKRRVPPLPPMPDNPPPEEQDNQQQPPPPPPPNQNNQRPSDNRNRQGNVSSGSGGSGYGEGLVEIPQIFYENIVEENRATIRQVAEKLKQVCDKQYKLEKSPSGRSRKPHVSGTKGVDFQALSKLAKKIERGKPVHQSDERIFVKHEHKKKSKVPIDLQILIDNPSKSNQSLYDQSVKAGCILFAAAQSIKSGYDINVYMRAFGGREGLVGEKRKWKSNSIIEPGMDVSTINERINDRPFLRARSSYSHLDKAFNASIKKMAERKPSKQLSGNTHFFIISDFSYVGLPACGSMMEINKKCPDITFDFLELDGRSSLLDSMHYEEFAREMANAPNNVGHKKVDPQRYPLGKALVDLVNQRISGISSPVAKPIGSQQKRLEAAYEQTAVHDYMKSIGL